MQHTRQVWRRWRLGLLVTALVTRQWLPQALLPTFRRATGAMSLELIYMLKNFIRVTLDKE